MKRKNSIIYPLLMLVVLCFGFENRGFADHLQESTDATSSTTSSSSDTSDVDSTISGSFDTEDFVTDEAVDMEEPNEDDAEQKGTSTSESQQKEPPLPQGEALSTDLYVTLLKKDLVIWQDFDWNKKEVSASVLGKTYHAKFYFEHENGETYYSLYTNRDQWLGYVAKQDVTVTANPQGPWLAKKQYVTVTQANQNSWRDFKGTTHTSSKKILNKTFLVKGYYQHFNGKTYYSLYNQAGKWQGYLDAKAVTAASGPQGKAFKVNRFVTVTNSNYSTWTNFNWKKRSTTKKLLHKTLQVRVSYEHFNGSTYYSLYDNAGKWQGYVTAKATKKADGKQGSFIGTNQFVTVTKKNYSTWSNFNWKKRSASNKLFNKTYQVKGRYHHFSGAIYYSLYDHAGRWQGYLNATATKKADGRQGIWLPTDREVVVTKKGYDVWRSFSWKKATTTTKIYNQSYRVSGYYRHFSGATYYSLYTKNGKWFGYVNAKAVRVKKGAATYFGTSRKQVLAELTKHQKDRFYLGTRYRSMGESPDAARAMSPNGAPNRYGPGLNCTGFVGVVMRRSGADLTKNPRLSRGWAGLANAYNWRDVLLANTRYETFNSVNDLLKSGHAKKGDIIYFEADRSVPNYDPHMGIFWGNNSRDNKFWHSSYPSNKITNIKSYYKSSKIYLFKLD